MTNSEKLRALADWFDQYDAKQKNDFDKINNQVQSDLRAMATEFEQLNKLSVVRGGAIEAQSVPLEGEALKWTNSAVTQITPTEPLATEAGDTGVSDGERCPRCKSVNIVDVDDNWTKCQSCEFSFVGG